MIDAPGYYVHQWNLHNADLVRPLWVSFLLVHLLRVLSATLFSMSCRLTRFSNLCTAHSRLRLHLLVRPPVDQNRHPPRLVPPLRRVRQPKQHILVGLHGRQRLPVPVGSAVYDPAQHAMRTSPSHLGVLGPRQVLQSAQGDAYLGLLPGRDRFHHGAAAAEDHLDT